MNSPITKYEHHGLNVAVVEEFKGKHRDLCICHQCERFKPNTEENCSYAEMAFQLSKLAGLVTVMECQFYS